MKTGKETAEVFNNFFCNIIKNLNIFQCSDFDPIIVNVKDPTLKAIIKYEKHLSILAIKTNNRNVIGMVLLVLGRSVLRKLKQKLGY